MRMLQGSEVAAGAMHPKVGQQFQERILVWYFLFLFQSILSLSETWTCQRFINSQLWLGFSERHCSLWRWKRICKWLFSRVQDWSEGSSEWSAAGISQVTGFVKSSQVLKFELFFALPKELNTSLLVVFSCRIIHFHHCSYPILTPVCDAFALVRLPCCWQRQSEWVKPCKSNIYFY